MISLKTADSPIKKNIIANLFGIGVMLFTQIILVPFYIHFWGTELYSDWIVISAITAFFSMSDVGLNTVTQNRFSISLAQKNKKDCNALLANNFAIVTGIFVLTIILCITYVSLFDLSKQLKVHVLNRTDTNIIFIFLICKVFIRMYSTIENSIYRATHHASNATYFDQITNLLTSLIILTCLIINIPIYLMSCLICIPDLLLIVFKHWHSKRYYRYTFISKDINIPLLKEIFTPSVSFLSFPIGNAIILQGYSLVVNKYFGADSVVLYNTTRTMCNFIKTLLATVQNSIWPEYSIAFGEGDYDRLKVLHRKAIKTALFLSILVCAILIETGPIIYNIWTHGEIQFEKDLMRAFLVVLLIENLWSSSSVALLATNNHNKLGIAYVIGSLMSLIFATIIGEHSSLDVIVYTMLLMQIPLCIYTLKEGFKLTKDNLFSVHL